MGGDDAGDAPAIERATIDDLSAVVEDRREFWGERELPALHHPLLVHEFGDTALVVRDGEGRVIAYLFGLLTPEGIGYIHLVAVREGHRREGLGERLYGEFEARVRRRGAVALRSFTNPVNARSIAFHRAMGFTAEEVPGYAWGEMRVVFTRRLASEGQLGESI